MSGLYQVIELILLIPCRCSLRLSYCGFRVQCIRDKRINVYTAGLNYSLILEIFAADIVLANFRNLCPCS